MKLIHKVLVSTLCLTLLGHSASSLHAEETKAAEASKQVLKWTVNLDKINGIQKYGYSDPQLAKDGTSYFMSRPVNGSAFSSLISISASGKVNWVYRVALKDISYNVVSPGNLFRATPDGNVFMEYHTENDITVQRIGTDGKPKAEYRMTGAIKNFNAFRITYLNGGILYAARAEKDGTIRLVQYNAQGKVIWQKPVGKGFQQAPKGTFSVTHDMEIIDNHVVVHQASYVEVYNLKGDKLWRISKKTNERYSPRFLSDGSAVAEVRTIEKGASVATRLVGIHNTGKTRWTLQADAGSNLYRFGNSFVYTNTNADGRDRQLTAIDPATGKTTASFSSQVLAVMNKSYYEGRDYMADPYLFLGEYNSNYKNTGYRLLDPVTLKPVPLPVDLNVFSKRDTITAQLKPLYLQQGSQPYVLYWNSYELRRYDL
ncbi:PQQ-binding-like beta-propeller repeat protein [Gorillibacterium sp. CAU 1737]|uniref:outer membrane protein assembly factor BamB family protein n=1 Tax=Gorillibacterium sp. CAU 1737 TaxID=3140362 RepID=UPI0032611CCB